MVLFNKMDLSDLTEIEIEFLEQKEMELGAAAVLFGSANTKGCGELFKSYCILSVYENDSVSQFLIIIHPLPFLLEFLTPLVEFGFDPWRTDWCRQGGSGT